MKSSIEHRAVMTLPQESKRQLLRGITALIGCSAAAQFVSGNAFAVALSYEAKLNTTQQAGQIFSQSQMKVLADICAVVLPKTDTPSAADLGVHGFIDHQLAVCYGKQQQEQSLEIVDKIDRNSQKQFLKPFAQLPFAQQTQLLVALELPNLGFSSADKQLFKQLKWLLIFGYFTTEVGATELLSYQAVPGGFKGSIPYDSVGKSYGSMAFY